MPKATELYIKILFVPHREHSLCPLQNQSNNICREGVNVYCENQRKRSGARENVAEFILQWMVSTFTTSFESKQKTI